MSIRLSLFFIISFLGLNGCLYSCNYAPELKTYNNPDKCDESGKSQLVKFVSVTGANGSLDIKMIMLLPCKGDGAKSDTYSLAFYNADNYKEPKNLTQVNIPAAENWGFQTAFCGEDADINNQQQIEKGRKNKDLEAIGEGAAVTLGVGAKHSSRLYPYAVKIPMSNPNVLGKGDSCANNANMSPFIQDERTLSPVFSNGRAVITDSTEALLGVYDRSIIELAAPLFTYGVLLAKEGEDAGLQPAPNITTSGSFSNFEVKLKPGRYYVILAKVPNPMGAMTGDYSQSDIKIYANNEGDNNIQDYTTECGNTIACAGKATAVTVR